MMGFFTLYCYFCPNTIYEESYDNVVARAKQYHWMII